MIYSRWEARDPALARWHEAEGWYESGAHEDGFLGVRRLYDWDAGDYRIRIAPDGLDADGEWFGLWITDLSTDETTWIGSLKFPPNDGTARISPRAVATIELYGRPIRPIDTPPWHVSVKPPRGDGIAATKGRAWYPYDDREDPIFNSDVYYDPVEGRAHIRIGGETQRTHDARRWETLVAP